MENKIIFHPNIDDDPTDFTRLQDFAEASIDHIVLDGVTDQLGTLASVPPSLQPRRSR